MSFFALFSFCVETEDNGSWGSLRFSPLKDETRDKLNRWRGRVAQRCIELDLKSTKKTGGSYKKVDFGVSHFSRLKHIAGVALLLLFWTDKHPSNNYPVSYFNLRCTWAPPITATCASSDLCLSVRLWPTRYGTPGHCKLNLVDFSARFFWGVRAMCRRHGNGYFVGSFERG